MKMDVAGNVAGKKATRKLTEGPVGGHLLRLGAPMGLGVLAIALFNVVDTLFVGQLGTLPLAAMGFTLPVVQLVNSLTLGIGIGTTSVLSRAIGGQEKQEVQRLATDALLFAVIFVAALSTLGLVTIDPLFTLLGADAQTLPEIRAYMSVWYLGSICIVVPMVGNGAIRATGDTKTPAVVMSVAGIFNALLDPLLIFGWGPFPAMGLKGAALATVIARAITLVVSLWILIKREALITFAAVSPREVLGSWRRILGVGLPAGLSNLALPLGGGLLTGMVALHGPHAVAAYGVGMRLEMFAILPLIALGAGMAPFVGQNVGARKPERVAEALRKGIVFCLVVGFLVWALLALGRDLFATAFTDEDEVIKTLQIFLLILPLSYGAHGLFFVITSTFNAAGQPLRATAITFIKTPLLSVSLALLGASVWGLPGIFGGIATAYGLAALLGLWAVRPHLSRG
jgi:putative MATE family efflux protein